MKIFKYLKEKYTKLSKDIWYQKARDYSLDLFFTGLFFGIGIFLLRISNSFAQGFGFAIIIALVQEYIKYIAEVIKDIKKSK